MASSDAVADVGEDHVSVPHDQVPDSVREPRVRRRLWKGGTHSSMARTRIRALSSFRPFSIASFVSLNSLSGPPRRSTNRRTMSPLTFQSRVAPRIEPSTSVSAVERSVSLGSDEIEMAADRSACEACERWAAVERMRSRVDERKGKGAPG